MYHYVHNSTVYYSQDMETTQISINRGLDKEDVVHIYTTEHYLVTKRTKQCHLWQHDGPID